jgi:hypothetical protein
MPEPSVVVWANWLPILSRSRTVNPLTGLVVASSVTVPVIVPTAQAVMGMISMKVISNAEMIAFLFIRSSF